MLLYLFVCETWGMCNCTVRNCRHTTDYSWDPEERVWTYRLSHASYTMLVEALLQVRTACHLVCVSLFVHVHVCVCASTQCVCAYAYVIVSLITRVLVLCVCVCVCVCVCRYPICSVA